MLFTRSIIIFFKKIKNKINLMILFICLKIILLLYPNGPISTYLYFCNSINLLNHVINKNNK